MEAYNYNVIIHPMSGTPLQLNSREGVSLLKSYARMLLSSYDAQSGGSDKKVIGEIQELEKQAESLSPYEMYTKLKESIGNQDITKILESDDTKEALGIYNENKKTSHTIQDLKDLVSKINEAASTIQNAYRKTRHAQQGGVQFSKLFAALLFVINTTQTAQNTENLSSLVNENKFPMRVSLLETSLPTNMSSSSDERSATSTLQNGATETAAASVVEHPEFEYLYTNEQVEEINAEAKNEYVRLYSQAFEKYISEGGSDFVSMFSGADEDTKNAVSKNFVLKESITEILGNPENYQGVKNVKLYKSAIGYGDIERIISRLKRKNLLETGSVPTENVEGQRIEWDLDLEEEEVKNFFQNKIRPELIKLGLRRDLQIEDIDTLSIREQNPSIQSQETDTKIHFDNFSRDKNAIAAGISFVHESSGDTGTIVFPTFQLKPEKVKLIEKKLKESLSTKVYSQLLRGYESTEEFLLDLNNNIFEGPTNFKEKSTALSKHKRYIPSNCWINIADQLPFVHKAPRSTSPLSRFFFAVLGSYLEKPTATEEPTGMYQKWKDYLA